MAERNSGGDSRSGTMVASVATGLDGGASGEDSGVGQRQGRRRAVRRRRGRRRGAVAIRSHMHATRSLARNEWDFSHSPRPGGEAKIALFEPVLEASQATKHARVAPSICEWRK